jgi:fatty-acyl-CoA synthase
MKDGERYLHLPPLYHSGGVVYLNAMALLGGTNVLIPAFDPAAVLDLVESERITALLAVPTMLQLLLRESTSRSRDTSSWSIGVFGAAPMPAHAIEDLLETFPTVRFSQQCGQTEAGPTGLYSTPEQVRGRPDSSGHQAQTFVEARVVDPGGRQTPANSVGELCFRGPAIMKGYWNDPEATAGAIRDGWLHTGDLVQVREDGSMKLVDRLKDLIITGGRNVYSAEVEQALIQHPEVVDCAVIGEPDDVWGETVVAVVTAVPGSTLSIEELREHCAQLIADYKAPRVLRIAEIPRNPAGKIQKHLLRQG